MLGNVVVSHQTVPDNNYNNDNSKEKQNKTKQNKN